MEAEGGREGISMEGGRGRAGGGNKGGGIVNKVRANVSFDLL
jgi:hypothetical protein